MEYKINLKHHRWKYDQRVLNVEKFAPSILLCNDDLNIGSDQSINQENKLDCTFYCSDKFENSFVRLVRSITSITLFDDAESNIDPRDDDHDCFIDAFV